MQIAAIVLVLQKMNQEKMDYKKLINDLELKKKEKKGAGFSSKKKEKKDK